MKIWLLVSIALIIIAVLSTRLFPKKEGFKDTQIKLGNGETVNISNLSCDGCRSKPGSQNTIIDCICEGKKMKEISLTKSCRGKGYEIMYWKPFPEGGQPNPKLACHYRGGGTSYLSGQYDWRYA